MKRISPTLEGFRAAARRPLLTAAEIIWRWTVGITTCAVLVFGLVEYLKTLPLTDADILLLRTRNAFLVGQALAHIFRGSLQRASFAVVVAFFTLLLLWIMAASIGRYFTTRALLEYFWDFAAEYHVQGASAIRSAGRFRVVLGLSFLRAAVFLAGLFGLVAAGFFASFVSSSRGPGNGLAFFVFVPLALFVLLAVTVLNWFLSLVCLFAVRDELSTLESICAAVAMCRDRFGAVLAVSTWSGLAHTAIFLGGTTVVSFPIALAGLVNVRIVVTLVLFLTLIYFALVDFLYISRLAGYVCIAELPQELLAHPVHSPPSSTPPIQTTIDRDEPILSDIPFPVTP